MAGFVALVGLAAAAQANDRGLRGTMISPSSCQVNQIADRGPDCGVVSIPALGYFTGNGWVGLSCQLVLACPLSINNIDLGGTSSDNDVSKFRVSYRARLASSQVIVRLIRSQVSGSGFISSSICGGPLSPTTTFATKTVVPCAHDVVEDGVFYHFEIILKANGSEFYGIDFPP